MKEPPTKVIFRKWKNEDVIAIFPQISADPHWYNCLSYEHADQHGSCDLHGLTRELRLATPGEYRPLAQELRRKGYRLNIRTRATQKDAAMRKAQIKQ